MYLNGKMQSVETSRNGGEENKGEYWRGGVNSSMIYFIHCMNFCKCHNVPTAQLKTEPDVC
jgi:hypothetical protein